MNQLSTELHSAVAQALQQHGLVYKVMKCDPAFADTAAFCEHYKIAAEQTCNAILGASKSEPIKYGCCVILSTCKLDVNKKLCQLLGVKRCSFASAELTLELTHMEIGGVTPVGVPEMPVFIDAAIMAVPEIILGGGNRSSKLLIAPAELTKLPHVQIVEGLGIPR
jgi:prolyl-tRNA editing enzyme YbaK/EbsC (Cys-tRNA(Pro) deacylase)